MFSSICQPDNLSFCMGPLEYIEAHEKAPRLMAILCAIQGEMRAAMKAKHDEKKTTTKPTLRGR